MSAPRITEIAHLFVERCLRPGDRAVDATAGNGYDTRFLADLVGPGGRVDAFDLQLEAVTKTREKTAHLPQVRVHHAGHERMEEHVTAPVKAVMFNLGYLPSGDKSVITRPDSTLAALDAAVRLLDAGGVITVVAYPGHGGGEEETTEVTAWFRSLCRDRFRVLQLGPLDRPGVPDESPRLLAAWRGKRAGAET